MYRDVAQWSSIRRRILQDGVSIRQVARETGIEPRGPSARCSITRYRSHMGREAEGIRSSGRISPRSSGWS